MKRSPDLMTMALSMHNSEYGRKLWYCSVLIQPPKLFARFQLVPSMFKHILPADAVEKARWRCYGCILEQEGDSFTIAFHGVLQIK